MDGFDASVLRRLPLVEASAVVLGHVLDREFLNQLFDDHGVGSEPRESAAVRGDLSGCLSGVWQPLWKKPPNKKRWKPPEQKRVRGGHSSAWKLLQAARGKPKRTSQ